MEPLTRPLAQRSTLVAVPRQRVVSRTKARRYRDTLSAGRCATRNHLRRVSAFRNGASADPRRGRYSVLDERRDVACMLLLLLDGLLFLRRVLRLLLAFLWRLMGHGLLLLLAETVAPGHYRRSEDLRSRSGNDGVTPPTGLVSSPARLSRFGFPGSQAVDRQRCLP